PRQRPDMFIQRLLTATTTGMTLQLYGDGRQRRDFTYIDDAIAATIAAGTLHLPNSVINVGAGSTVCLNDVVDHARQITGRPINIRPASPHSGDVPITCADPSYARRQLGWTPTTDLFTGMGEQIRWMHDSRSRTPVEARTSQ